MPRTVHVPDADDPSAALAAVVALRRLADRLELESVEHAVRQGWSWVDIADVLGVSRQAVHKRHAARLRNEGGQDVR